MHGMSTTYYSYREKYFLRLGLDGGVKEEILSENWINESQVICGRVITV
jgi:hypothetical protein